MSVAVELAEIKGPGPDAAAHDPAHAPAAAAAGGAEHHLAPRAATSGGAGSALTQAERDAVHRIFDPNCPDYIAAMDKLTEAQVQYYIDYVSPEGLKVLMDKGAAFMKRHPHAALVEAPATISFRNLFYKKNGRMRLQGVSGYLKPRQLVCVLGGPDSGITSLLMVLSGRQQGGLVTGELLVNGSPPDEMMRRRIGFIPKDDIAFPTLTVQETLEFSARLRLSSSIPDRVKRLRAATVMKLLGLRHTANTVVGSATLRGVSGGEKRRVSIGVEMVAGHSSILADLPTNGLDSASAFDVIANYKKLAAYGGRSLMCSLVQPSPQLLNLFDNVLLMSKGVCVYFGPVDRVNDYLFGLGYQMPVHKALPDYLEELSVAPERFYQGPGVTDEKGNIVVHHVASNPSLAQLMLPRVTSQAALDDLDSTNAPKERPVGKVELDYKGVPTLTLDDIARKDSGAASMPGRVPPSPYLMTGGSASNGNTAAAQELTMAQPQPLPAREPALDDEFGGRDPNAPKPTRHLSVKGHKVIISHYDAMTHLFRAYKKSDEYRNLGLELWGMEPTFVDPKESAKQNRGKKYNASFMLQVQLCLMRQFQIVWRNKSGTIGGFVRQIFIALLVGSLFWQVGTHQKDARTRFGLFFFMLSFNTMGSIQSIPALMEQRTVYYSQTDAGYYKGAAFYISYVLTEIPLSALNTFIFTVILYPMSGLTNGVQSEEYGYLFTLIFVVNLVSKGWCLFMASVCPNQPIAQAITPITMLLYSMFSGYMVPKNSIPNGWIWMYYMSFFTYSIRGLCQNELLPKTFTCEADELLGLAGSPSKVCPIQSGYDALKQYNMEPDLRSDGSIDTNEKWIMLRNVVLFFIAFNVAACVALLKLNYWNSDSSIVGNFDEEEDDEALDEVILEDAPKNDAVIGGGAVAVDVDAKPHRSMVVTPTSLSFFGLTYTVDVPKKGVCAGVEQRQLLKHVFGYCKPGMMMALMGPSGAGKTTLLDVLANKKTGGRVTGSFLINGKPRDASFQLISGYVEQFDSHDETSTVREAIEFSARLRLPPDMDEHEKLERVEAVLDTLGLRPFQHTQIGAADRGGISPELRKKVTIAVELVMNPAILFLDEPTTGLDSLGALAVMEAVRKLASTIAVVCTIHQPSSEIMNKFDSLLLMKKGGEVGYCGPLSNLSDYLGSVGLGRCPPGRNIADHALEVAGGGVKMTAGKGKEAPKDPAQLFLASPDYQFVKQQCASLGCEVNAPRDDLIPLGDPATCNPCASDTQSWYWTQVSQLLARFVKAKLRDKQTLRSRMISAIVISLLLGTLYYQLGNGQLDAANRVSLMYLSALFPCFSAAAVIPVVIAARTVYFRERQAKMYTPLAYYMGRTLSEQPFIAVEGFLYCTILYWTAGLKDWDNGRHYGLFLAMYYVMRNLGYAFAELGSSIIEMAQDATAFNSVLMTLFMLFTGFLVPKSGIPQGWIWMFYLSCFRYPVSFLVNNELTGLDFECANNVGALGPLPRFNTSDPTDALRIACTTPVRQTTNSTCYGYVCPVTSGGQMLKQFGMADDDMGIFFAITCGMVVGYRLLSFLALRNINHIKR